MERTWQRIVAHSGETFHQKLGGSFTYRIEGNTLIPNRTNHRLARSQFEKALDRMPIDGPGQLHDLRGPSYLFAILTDARIRDQDW
jgi:hypothetical protein